MQVGPPGLVGRVPPSPVKFSGAWYEKCMKRGLYSLHRTVDIAPRLAGEARNSPTPGRGGRGRTLAHRLQAGRGRRTVARCRPKAGTASGGWGGDFEMSSMRLGLSTDHEFDHLAAAPPGGSRGASARGAALAGELLRLTPALAPLAAPVALAAAHEVTVLLIGETGTGKTHLARLIHQHSARSAQRLLVVPCGALAPSLAESELFGHAKGAFTGAEQAKFGKFEAAGSGTILLDEVDALGLEQQAKLLRVLETGEFEPVGSNDTRRCKARVIAASNVDLERAVEQGAFRQDLFYRLNVLALYLPPLRERSGDVACLARDMAARFGRGFGRGPLAVGAEALALLEGFGWPGNVRQLENVVQQAVLLSDGPELLPRHLPALLREGRP